MMWRTIGSRTLLFIALTIGVVLLLNSPTEAQCSMCKAVLSNTNARFIRNFNIGVLVLLLPPVSIFCSIFVVLKRYRTENPESKDEGLELGANDK
jgi:hypothetical protein